MTESSKSSNALFEKREKIFPREVHGIFAFWRSMGVFILLGFYYLVPWIQWSDRQAILFDLPNRKFYIFDLILWPQDFIFLALLLIIAAIALFFFTAVAGRLWCGFACPQTVWTEVFLWIERKVEGSRPQQIKLENQAWTNKKIILKVTKHFLWISFSLFTGYTFVGYFTPIQELGGSIAAWTVGPWEGFWVLFYGFATYGNAGWMREQVCIYMCPYARFQSAMFDNDTLIISYDQFRGEPRGSRNRKVKLETTGLGACIDCSMCVQVCPTGIDIRDGLQYECIACGCCIDVCNDVMAKMNYAPNLIQFTTENQLQARDSGKKSAKIIRPRIVIYSVILTVLISFFMTALLLRQTVELDAVRDRNILYRMTNDGLIENIYTVKILNKDIKLHEFRLSIAGLQAAKLSNDKRTYAVLSGEILEISVAIRIDPVGRKSGSQQFDFIVVSIKDADMRATQSSRFITPR